MCGLSRRDGSISNRQMRYSQNIAISTSIQYFATQTILKTEMTADCQDYYSEQISLDNFVTVAAFKTA